MIWWLRPLVRFTPICSTHNLSLTAAVCLTACCRADRQDSGPEHAALDRGAEGVVPPRVD